MKLKIGLFLVTLVLLAFFLRLYGAISVPDIQCARPHVTTSKSPKQLKTAADFFELGNYNYEIGKCQEGVADYTRAIELRLNYTEAYNNRAYTNMRMRNYADALLDLDKAISLNPNYVNALMNRGDIHNYYYQIDRKAALADYNKAISLGARDDKSACGHKAMAETNNIIPLAFLRMFTNTACR